jgi:PEP-CTERM motif-containing protein
MIKGGGLFGFLMAAAMIVSGTFGPVKAIADSQTITSVNDDFSVLWSKDVAGGQLSATGFFDVLSVSSSEIQLQITVTNTTDAALHEAVNSIGFNTNPAVTASYVTTGGIFEGLGNDTNFPSFQTIEVCVFAAQNCTGGAYNNLLQSGTSDTFRLLLAGNFGTTPTLTLSAFPIKFQGDLGSYEFGATVGGPPVVTPEPSSILLFGSGLVGFAMWRWRSLRSTPM